MGVRKKGRVKFTFGGRLFVWWIDNDTYLRIASDDKRFIAGNLLIDRFDLLAVHALNSRASKRPPGRFGFRCPT